MSYSKGMTESQQLHNVAHTETILSIVDYSDPGLVIIVLIGKVA